MKTPYDQEIHNKRVRQRQKLYNDPCTTNDKEAFFHQILNLGIGMKQKTRVPFILQQGFSKICPKNELHQESKHPLEAME
jgi:hypothetical protein